jgi:hypothetical protein
VAQQSVEIPIISRVSGPSLPRSPKATARVCLGGRHVDMALTRRRPLCPALRRDNRINRISPENSSYMTLRFFTRIVVG